MEVNFVLSHPARTSRDPFVWRAAVLQDPCFGPHLGASSLQRSILLKRHSLPRDNGRLPSLSSPVSSHTLILGGIPPTQTLLDLMRTSQSDLERT